jgi:hypothetical protein
MSQVKSETPPGAVVEQVARLIRTFDHQQMIQLIELVPELQTIQSSQSLEETDQAGLIAYFDHRLTSLQTYPPLQDDSPFLAGLTAGEFFALPEPEQDRLWAEAHQEAERQLNHPEKQVQPDELPTR